MSFEALLQTIRDGDPVDAGTTNRPLRQIDGNVRYIWELLKASSIGSTLYAYRQTVDPTVVVGSPVYCDANGTFRPGLCAVGIDAETGALVPSPEAQVWGIVARKISEGVADILLYGLGAVDVSAAVVGPLAAGTYYLSPSAPGRLTAAKPPLAIAVLRRDASGRVLVTPQWADLSDRHEHREFSLACRPAGHTVQPGVGNRHTVTGASNLLRGWLPAGHVSFGGKAPAGAVFGYNIAADVQLAAVWPPVPVHAAELTWNKAVSADVGFTGVPLGRSGLCVVDANGIWWLSDCYGDVPWPLDTDTSVSDSASDSSTPECPRRLDMAMLLNFTVSNPASGPSSVLSLTPDDDRIKVRCGGLDRTTGHLRISLDFGLSLTDGAVGSLAIKTFDPVTGKFTRGPVAEGLYTTAPNVTLQGTVSAVREISGQNRTVHSGLVNVTVAPADTKELDVQLVRLDGAEEAYWGDPPNMYLSFPSDEPREYRAKIHVPSDLAIASPSLRIRLFVLGRAAGTLPALQVTARIFPAPPNGITTPVALPLDAAEFSVAITTTAVLGSPNTYVAAVSQGYAVQPGDTVFFTVKRSPADGYAGELGILRQFATVEAGS